MIKEAGMTIPSFKASPPNIARAAVFATALFMGGGFCRADAKLPDADARLADLVKAALESELGGPSETRKSLLDDALKLDPNHAPARWQSGFVRWDGEWLKFDEIAKIAASDEKLLAYRYERDILLYARDGHRQLAKWCHKHGLTAEERIHWAKVLELDPSDSDALNGLGLQLYEGRLLSRKQIEQAKARAGERLRAMRTWQPQLVKWRRAIEHGNATQADEALRNLHELKDPEVLPALDVVFPVGVELAKSPQLKLYLVEAVADMPQPEATQWLLRNALLTNSDEVVAAAADALKERPMQAYVPQLIAAMPANLKTQLHVHVMPDGSVVPEYELILEGQQFDVSMTYEAVVTTSDVAQASSVRTQTPATPGRWVTTFDQKVQTARQATEPMRKRIEFLLQRTTGFARVDDPSLWMKQYNDSQGLYTSDVPKPKYTRYTAETVYAQYRSPSQSCFPAGTPVLTIYGSRAIEQIQIGDRVLSQDVDSGELIYKPVQATTLRPPTPMVQLAMGSESIRATLGHPFWVIGKGWQMAKHLKAGDSLYTTNGAVSVDHIEKSTPDKAYNLVVSDFHDYFVGESKLLVHDNSPSLETSVRAPGLAADERK